jgi:hypothetical protein
MWSFKPGWGRPRLSIRALMIGVAALALAFASVWVYLPWLLWRVRVDRIIDKKLAGRDRHSNVLFDPTYETYYALTGPEYRDVLKDPRYVAERLIEDSANDVDPLRRAEAFSALWRLLTESASPTLAQEFLGRILRQAVAGTTRPDDESSAITVIQGLSAELGLDEAQRAAILARARTLARGIDPGKLLPNWAFLIGQIGGGAESEFLIELDDSRDPKSFTFDMGSRLTHSRLPVLLDHIRRWLDDPARALGALDYTILPCTTAGRELLLEVVLTAGRDDEVRRKAMRLLKRDYNGLQLLLRVCEDPLRRRVVGQFYGPDRHNLTVISDGLPAQLDGWYLPAEVAEAKAPEDPRPELRELSDHRDVISYPWNMLIGGISPSYWGHLRKRMLEEGKPESEVARVVSEIVAGDLAITQQLAGRGDLSKPEEWERWLRETKPDQITLGRWLDQMVAHPDLMRFKDFARYIDAPRSVPPELVPKFARLARAAPAGSRWRLCQTLLLYADRAEEAPLLIDDIEQELREHPVRFADRNSWPITILAYRFGVNHFWDVAAWRRWWDDYQRATPIGRPKEQ